jgi:GNAT superfamily N-acetyltransferase
VLELARGGDLVFYKFEEASEVNKFRILGVDDGRFSGGGFEFFRGLGIIGYEKTFKIWLRKFPRPVFIAAVRGTDVVSWVFLEEWEMPAYDGMAVWVLRAIETLPSLRKKKIGYRLLILAAQQCFGYLITKPLTPEADKFFRDAGFMSTHEFKKPPLDLSKHPGHLILPPYRKSRLLEQLSNYFK